MSEVQIQATIEAILQQGVVDTEVVLVFLFPADIRVDVLADGVGVDISAVVPEGLTAKNPWEIYSTSGTGRLPLGTFGELGAADRACSVSLSLFQFCCDSVDVLKDPGSGE